MDKHKNTINRFSKANNYQDIKQLNSEYYLTLIKKLPDL